jgi:hypothetical protein
MKRVTMYAVGMSGISKIFEWWGLVTREESNMAG